MRLCLLVVLIAFARSAIADPEAPHLSQSAADAEDAARLRIDQQRLIEQHVDAQHARRAEERAGYERALAESESRHEHDARTSHRHLGYAFAIVAGGMGVAAGTAAYLGKQSNREILDGGLATPDAISYKANRGKIYNYVGEGCAGAAALAFVIATPLIVFNLDRGEYTVAPAADAKTAGVTLSGRF